MEYIYGPNSSMNAAAKCNCWLSVNDRQQKKFDFATENFKIDFHFIVVWLNAEKYGNIKQWKLNLSILAEFGNDAAELLKAFKN